MSSLPPTRRGSTPQAMATTYPDQFRIDYALSREQENRKGGKMYIQDKMEEYADEIFDLLDNGAHIYFCGLKGMMPGIQTMLENVCKAKGLNYEHWFENLKEVRIQEEFYTKEFYNFCSCFCLTSEICSFLVCRDLGSRISYLVKFYSR